MVKDFVVDRAGRCLGWAEREWTPFQSNWWRYWTPDMGPGDRYPSGRFEGYYREPYDGLSSLIHTARLVRTPVIRQIYKTMPYVHVRPVVRGWDTMTSVEHGQRIRFVWDSTMHMYFHEDKPLYSRETIRHVEDQLDLVEQKQRRVSKLFAHCKAPRSRWINYKDYDDVVHWQRLGPHSYNNGRPQIEFRTIQELVQPDHHNLVQFLPDQWEKSIAYQPLWVVGCPARREMRTLFGEDDEQLSVNEMQERLSGHQDRISGTAEWEAIRTAAAATTARNTIGIVDKIVFFCDVGFSEDESCCRQTMFLLQLADLLCTLVRDCRDDERDQQRHHVTDIPIYVPAFRVPWPWNAGRKWSDAETQILQQLRVVQVESLGKLFLLVDENTAVISYGHHSPVKQVIADLARPAIMICKPVIGSYDFMYQTTREGGQHYRLPVIQHRSVNSRYYTDLYSPQARLLKANLGRDPDSPRVRRMLGCCDQYDLPKLPDARPGHHYEVVRFHVRQEHASVDPVCDLSYLSFRKSALPIGGM
ncbi:hypothetical protein QBC46DRAFT_395560 [Diplogelasinospora grovesii]|uniref:Uncharacterized protein n=1 Tax=Diplogelasinospora grovesii TaxID=303347 RepID=A0AAN6N0S5_9PEZI|nr:hypothetical protein QBC46DRAFT_395560 [Diplogelasinospora grovesii]